MKQTRQTMTPTIIISLIEGQTTAIAAETEDSRSERTQLIRKLSTLHKAEAILGSIHRTQSKGRFGSFCWSTDIY